jgi:UDP-galactose transporter
MSVVILRKSLSVMQWLALTILTVGASVVVVSQMGDSRQGGNTTESNGSFALGVAAVLLACLASGLAGVYFEKLLNGSTVSLWARNLQLAVYSLAVGFGGLYQSCGPDCFGPGFVNGYTPVVWAAVVNNALGGLLIAIVIKHADTILKNFATTLSIIVTTGVSAMFFGSIVNGLSVVGTALVIYAVFLYAGFSGLSAARALLARATGVGKDI